MCRSNESSPLVTQATPPCAQAVFESTPLRFVMIATRPCFAAFSAKVRPAMPLPMTTKSNSLIREECYRSNESGQKRPRPRGGCAARSLGAAAGRPRPRSRRNRSGRAEPISIFWRTSREHFRPRIFLPTRRPPAKRGPNDRRLRTLFRAEILIARAERETVRFAHGRAGEDLDREIEIADHSPNDGELLKILFPKNRRVRREEMKQLRHHRADAAEMARPGSAAEPLRKRRFLDESRAIVRIHFVRRGPKDQIHAFRAADFLVRRFRPRIAGKIRARARTGAGSRKCSPPLRRSARHSPAPAG